MFDEFVGLERGDSVSINGTQYEIESVDIMAHAHSYYATAGDMTVSITADARYETVTIEQVNESK